MILEIDIGNSFLKWRLRDADAGVIARGRQPTRDPLDALVAQWCGRVDAVWVGSVADEQIDAALVAALSAAGCPSPRFARTRASAAGVRNSYAKPETMGVDRWLAMLAAWSRVGRALCVVDCGSAITIDFLDDSGTHRGGFILPGMRMLQQALLGNTARVFVERPGSVFCPRPASSTSEAVTQGADFMFDAIVQRLAQEVEAEQPLFVTGGDGELFHRRLGRGEWVPDLVLDGLAPALEAD
jgi:type III pantothenate kinase